MNNCESGNRQLSITLNNTFVEQIAEYTSIYQRINQLISDLDSCCENKNERYQHIADSLEQLIYNLIDCCKKICNGLDEWIIIIIPDGATITFEVEWTDGTCTYDDEEPPYPGKTFEVEWTDGVCVFSEEPIDDSTTWEAEWTDHTCAKSEEEPPAPYITFDVEWENHTCTYSEPPIPPFVDTFDVNWTNHTCSFEWDCDVHGTLDDIINVDDPTVTYFAEWVEHTCKLRVVIEADVSFEFIVDGDAYGITTTTTTFLMCEECDLYIVTSTTTTTP